MKRNGRMTAFCTVGTTKFDALISYILPPDPSNAGAAVPNKRRGINPFHRKLQELGFSKLIVQFGNSKLDFADCLEDVIAQPESHPFDLRQEETDGRNPSPRRSGRKKGSKEEDEDEVALPLLEIETYKFKPSLKDDMTNSDLIICSGGAGTLLEALELKKLILVLPNLTLQDNHQVELIEALEEEGYLVSVKEAEQLPEGLEKLMELASSSSSKPRPDKRKPQSSKSSPPPQLNQWLPPTINISDVLQDLLK